METGFLSSKDLIKYDADTKAKIAAKYVARPHYLQAIKEIEG